MSEQVRRKLKAAMQENARLQAKVERLTERNQHLEQIDSYLQSANLNAEEQRSIELEAENARLKAEVETLRKLGTEMGKHLPDTDEANRAYIDFEAGGKS